MNSFLLPFIVSLLAGLSTTLGCFFIFVKPKNINKFIGVSLAFSMTIMLLISIFELIPNGFIYIQNEYGFFKAIFALIGMLFVGNSINAYINKKIAKTMANSENLYRVGILSMIALMVHNLPEGILTFLSTSVDVKLGIKMAIAIMLHNIPEGIAIAVPIYYGGKSKKKAFLNTLVSGFSEPIGALFAYLFLSKYISDTLISLVILFVAGIMISISINDIFKEAEKYSKKHLILGFILGLMMTILTEFIL